MFDLRHILTTAVFAVAATGCFAEDDGAVVQVSVSTAPLQVQRGGTLLAEFNPHVSNGVALHAQFLEARGVTLQAANDALDVWTPDLDLDEGTCSLSEPRSQERQDIRLRMLDVGTITVETQATTNGHRATLVGRRVPDLATLSGVVYGNEGGVNFDEVFLPYEPHTTYAIKAPGGSDTGGFAVVLRAPQYPVFDVVSGHFVVDDAPIALEGADLALAWNALDDRASLYIDVASATRRLSCRVEDSGNFVIPASALENLGGANAATPEGTRAKVTTPEGTRAKVTTPEGTRAKVTAPLVVTMRRVDHVALPIDGVDQGTFVFAASNEVRVTR